MVGLNVGHVIGEAIFRSPEAILNPVSERRPTSVIRIF